MIRKNNEVESSTNFFRCKIYEDFFQDILNSYKKKSKNLTKYILKGGAGSGKSINVASNIVFWLPEKENDEALIYVYSTSHKSKLTELFENILFQHGYYPKVRKKEDGTTVIYFANNNKIRLISISTSSIEELKEKIKVNTSIEPRAKFIWFEEFTASLLKMKNIETYYDIESRILRSSKLDSFLIYTYNPPINKKHIVYNFEKEENINTIFSTIYDLPKKWQDKNTLEVARKLKDSNKNSYQHIYLGMQVGIEGLAFNVDGIWEEPHEKEEYIRFWIQTDEGTVNATTFALYGMLKNGVIHLIDLFYHSSKEDGIFYSPSQYAQKFKNWYKENDINAEIVTDGIAFAIELENVGFEAQSIGSLKDRVLSYVLANKLVSEDKFKIIKHDNNMMFYVQMENAEVEYNKEDKPIVSKKKESTNDNLLHSHALDTFLYLCLRIQGLIMKKN